MANRAALVLEREWIRRRDLLSQSVELTLEAAYTELLPAVPGRHYKIYHISIAWENVHSFDRWVAFAEGANNNNRHFFTNPETGQVVTQEFDLSWSPWTLQENTSFDIRAQTTNSFPVSLTFQYELV